MARPIDALGEDARNTAFALALLWTWKPRTTVWELVRALGFKTAGDGRSLTAEHVKAAIADLHKAGLATEQLARPGYHRLAEPVRTDIYKALLDHFDPALLRHALHGVVHFNADRARGYWALDDTAATIAVLRLELFTATDARLLGSWQEQLGRRYDWNEVFIDACFGGHFDAGLFARIVPQSRWSLANYASQAVCDRWLPDYLPYHRWALAQAAADPRQLPDYLRLQLAESQLHGGDAEDALSLLAGDDSGIGAAIRAGLSVQRGAWNEAQAAFEAAIKRRQVEVSARKRVLRTSLAWLYPMALMAQGTPSAIEVARKFCVGESGSRAPRPEGWGLWAHACAVRLGDQPLDASAFDTALQVFQRPTLENLWALLLRAWLAAEYPLRGDARQRQRYDESVTRLRRALQDCELHGLDALATAADRILKGQEAGFAFFAGGGREAWRTVLGSLLALADEGAERGAVAGGDARLVWQLEIGREGTVEAIEPFEQKRGPRGWSKPKPVPLSKLSGNVALAPHDARVAGAIRADRRNARRFWIDRAAAIAALIGHPTVVLAGALDQLVDVVEGVPQLETVREKTRDGERFVLRVSPAPHAEAGEDDGDEYRYFLDEAQRREFDALRFVHVRQDSPQRVRVIRLTPAQRRAAQLVSGSFAIPASAQGELQQALRALAGHFDVHTDDAAAARQIDADAQLRAELSPAGDGLLLRLVVAPLGPQGPRLAPGHGRRRMMAAIAGESIGCERDLAAEQAHLDAVLERLDFLDPLADGGNEWTVDDPELALAMVEALPTLPAVAALDWPRGKPVRVATVDLKHLQISVTSQRDWLSLTGRATLDEGKVLELQALLAAAQAKSRFVALGDGAYLALSKSLRERLQALAAVAEAGKSGVVAPVLAAPWLEETLAGAAVDFDREFRERLDRLRSAQETTPTLPASLQAELRPYQEDGFAWATRLAAAGFGACLADDMGLGKTLQALAVLLARGAGGPALVVAPTSVCGNWLAEAARFAPSLDARIYGESERSGIIEKLGANTVLIVSYTLMQQAGEAFAARRWHTLIADEAQAVKNATAKRSQALFDLPADFRLALSGTPVENRLSELWSIMRFCNPGLLGTLNRFNERFATPIERSRDRDAQRILRRLVAPFVLRRTKAQVLDDLPARTELVLNVAPEGDEAAHYEALRRNLVGEAEALAAGPAGPARLHILAQLMKLRRAACDPRLVTPDLGYVGAKVRAFAELAAELAANGHKALVFSQFVDFLTLLRAPLDAAGIAYQYLDGSTPPAERTRRVAAFQEGEGTLFLISLKAGGFGLNLTAADYVVITDPWWNPAAEDQAMGRAHRIGQLRPVTVYRLVNKGTLEERIIELHHDKRALAEGVLAAGEDGATLPSTGDLIALMRG